MNPIRKAQILQEGHCHNLIHPGDLLHNLLQQDLSKCKCHCAEQQAKILEQKAVLHSLINQYICEIELKKQEICQRDQLIPIRNSLKGQIQLLIKQRKQINCNLQTDIHQARSRPLQLIESYQITTEIKNLHVRNMGIEKKIQEFVQYIAKMEFFNENLSVNRNIKENELVCSRRRAATTHFDHRLTALQANKENYISQMQARLRAKQVQGQNHRRMQEAQIAQRNRRRWEAFQHDKIYNTHVQVRRSRSIPRVHYSPPHPLVRSRVAYSPSRVIHHPQPVYRSSPIVVRQSYSPSRFIHEPLREAYPTQIIRQPSRSHHYHHHHDPHHLYHEQYRDYDDDYKNDGHHSPSQKVINIHPANGPQKDKHKK